MPGRRHRWRGGSEQRGVWFLEPALLMLLHHDPAYGYTLLERLEELGLRGLHPSMAYRALRDMDERGWVTSSWDVDKTLGPPRRVYRLTALGDETLKTYMQDLRQVYEQIGDLMDAYQRHMEEGEGEHH